MNKNKVTKDFLDNIDILLLIYREAAQLAELTWGENATKPTERNHATPNEGCCFALASNDLLVAAVIFSSRLLLEAVQKAET